MLASFCVLISGHFLIDHATIIVLNVSLKIRRKDEEKHIYTMHVDRCTVYVRMFIHAHILNSRLKFVNSQVGLFLK